MVASPPLIKKIKTITSRPNISNGTQVQGRHHEIMAANKFEKVTKDPRNINRRAMKIAFSF